MTPRQRMRSALAGAVLALTFTLTWSLAKVPTLEDRADASDRKATQALDSVAGLNDAIHANSQALADANRRLVALGKPPVPVPTPVPSVAPQGLTAADVREIVQTELSQHKAVLTQAEVQQIARVAAALVPKPKDGVSPSATQLQLAARVAVAAYCTGDKCVKPGPEGKQGPKGADGEDAPKVTDEQLLAAAVAARDSYCAQDTHPCDAVDGKDGADAPIVVDVDCEGADGLKFTFNFDRGHGPITAECKP